ncbi:MAG: glutamine synthetase III [Fretibacterium sp.]|nr:glutamine synthetase III [Fretibacterium sp.]
MRTGEPDASSFPSAGTRSTFEARGSPCCAQGHGVLSENSEQTYAHSGSPRRGGRGHEAGAILQAIVYFPSLFRVLQKRNALLPEGVSFCLHYSYCYIPRMACTS